MLKALTICRNIVYIFCSIESHVVFHLGEKTYKCDTCEESNKTNIDSQLTVHYINGYQHGGCHPKGAMLPEATDQM